jgi:hypothetical protein
MQRNVDVPMRDGVILRADVYRPHSDGPFPVILTRTPYNKSGLDGAPSPTYEGLAAAGYIVVAQDVRGRYASKGEFTPLFAFGYPDIEDGYDSVEWCAQLPDSSGDVGIFGNSYGGFTSYCAAFSAAPSLRCVFAEGMTQRLSDFEPHFRPGRRFAWSMCTIAPDIRLKKGLPGTHSKDEADQLWERERHKWLWYLPRKDIPDELFGGPDQAGHYRILMTKAGVDTFQWQDRYQDVRVPVYHRAGWYDRFVRAIDGHTLMAEKAATPAAREGQRAMIGPWGHTSALNTYEGEVNFGPDGLLEHPDLLLRWFDHWLKGQDTGIMDEGPIRLYILGENTWRDEHEWPLARTQYTDYFLHSAGNAQTPNGDGNLNPNRPSGETPDQFVYDPRDPVPSVHLMHDQDGVFDQRVLDSRRDVLVYQTEPLSAPLEVTGEPTVHLFASSSAVDTDFMAKLVDVHPNGFAQNLCYGVVRARYRNGYATPQLLTPGQIYEFTIAMNPIANVFQPGHRLRVDITSSDFPNWDRNLNSGSDGYDDATMVTARQTVLHDANHPTRITLPLIPRQ